MIHSRFMKGSHVELPENSLSRERGIILFDECGSDEPTGLPFGRQLGTWSQVERRLASVEVEQYKICTVSDWLRSHRTVTGCDLQGDATMHEEEILTP